VQRCRIGDHTRIGHFNLFLSTKELLIEDHVRIGYLNLLRGGDLIHIQRYAEIFRANIVNSILEPEVETTVLPEFRLGAGSVITTAHWIDFTDKVTIGNRSMLGGRNSSLWTHTRQWAKPIHIGSHVYLGSEVRLAPGATVPSLSIVGLGSVIINAMVGSRSLFAGNPARRVKQLGTDSLRLLTRKTRRDLPDDVGLDEAEVEVFGQTVRERTG
jgi:acetyltransferase-like isoleucine patch superfamily enzyme